MVGKGQAVCNEGSLIRLLGCGVGFGQDLVLELGAGGFEVRELVFV